MDSLYIFLVDLMKAKWTKERKKKVMIVMKGKKDWGKINSFIIRNLWNIQSYDLEYMPKIINLQMHIYLLTT